MLAMPKIFRCRMCAAIRAGRTGMGLVRTMAERYCHGLGTCANKEIQQ